MSFDALSKISRAVMVLPRWPRIFKGSLDKPARSGIPDQLAGGPFSSSAAERGIYLQAGFNF